MKRHGELTAQLGELLAHRFSGRGYEVLYDHGLTGENVGTIVSWFERADGFSREAELSQLDIAIVDVHTQSAVLLMELEETNDRPKTFLGDLFGTLMGDGIRFAGSKELVVDEHTTLLVAGVSRFDHHLRAAYLCDKVYAVKPALSSGNAQIGAIHIQTFADDERLVEKLAGAVEALILKRETART